MPPKRKAKVARQSPALLMMADSPDRGGASGSTAKRRPPASLAVPPLPFDVGRGAGKDAKGKSKEAANIADLLWCDCFMPVHKSELAIHKRKVEQVEGWLREALDGKGAIKRYRRILTLSGPAGSGKSSLVKLLSASDQLNFQIVEWKSEDMQGGGDSDYYWDRGRSSSTGVQRSEELQSGGSNSFGLFLSGASRYASLAMDTEEDQREGQAGRGEPQSSAASTSSSSRRVILLEDLPNVSHMPTRAAFNAALDTFLKQTDRDHSPLVLIMSENVPRLDEWAESSTRDYRDRADATLTVRSLIPPLIRSDVGFTHLEFNAVAPTILAKALKRVLELARPSHPASIPAISSASAKELVAAIVEGAAGDIRSATNTLQVLCLRGHSLIQRRGVKRAADGKAVGGGAKGVSRRAIAGVSGRESSLVVFHALGKVLYNKRVGDPDDKDRSDSDGDDEDGASKQAGMEEGEGEDDVPCHWKPLAKRRSRVDVEALWRSMPVDAGTLSAFLHQNYTPFCDTIEQCAAFSDNISLADSLRPAHEEWFHTPLTDYYSYLISVHGSLLALPSPVPRNQMRKMTGVALFQHMKKLRENKEALADLQMALQEEAMEQTEGRATMVLSEASATNLICEVLPLVSKSHATMVSPGLKHLVHLPWIGQSEAAMDTDDESGEETMQSAHDLPSMPQAWAAADANNPTQGRNATTMLSTMRPPDGENNDDDDDIEE